MPFTDTQADFTGCTVSHNKARGGAGGAIAITTSNGHGRAVEVNLTDCAINFNAALEGGGALAVRSSSNRTGLISVICVFFV